MIMVRPAAEYPPLTNFVIYPLCFTAYTLCDVTPQLFSLKGGGALIQKPRSLLLCHRTVLDPIAVVLLENRLYVRKHGSDNFA